MQSYLCNKSSSSFSCAKLQIIFVLSKKKKLRYGYNIERQGERRVSQKLSLYLVKAQLLQPENIAITQGDVNFFCRKSYAFTS